MFKVIGEKRVKRELERRSGSYSVRLGRMDLAWNPLPHSALERQAKPSSGAPFAGPGTVAYTRVGDNGEVQASFRAG